MGKLTRKNLVVDAEKIRELARRRGTSESEAVRQVVDFALIADEVMEAIEELHARGGIDDVFGKLSDDTDDVNSRTEAENAWPAPKSSTAAS